MPLKSGRHFLQIPGPTNVPDRVLRALASPTIDHRGPQFAELTHEVMDGLKQIFKTEQKVLGFPASGTGAWEAALVNTLSPGDRVLMFETGQFAVLWCELAKRLGLEVDFLPGDWRHGAEPAAIGAKLEKDADHRIKAVAIVHNETSTVSQAASPRYEVPSIASDIRLCCSWTSSPRWAASITAMTRGEST